VLLPSLGPCGHFSGACRGYARWQPDKGHVPRSYIGAWAGERNVQLVIVTAEPGEPSDGEGYSADGGSMMQEILAFQMSALTAYIVRHRGRPAPFHRNMRFILDACWPGSSLSEQLKKTWITAAVLCSAHKSGGPIPAQIEATCANTYLLPQLKLMPQAFVLALGAKAARRLVAIGRTPNFLARHPSARPINNPQGSWIDAGRCFQAWLTTQMEANT